MAKNVLILAGGGGHTGYGYALAQRLYGKANLHFLVPERFFKPKTVKQVWRG